MLLLSQCNKFVSLLRGATEKKVIVVGGPAGCCGVVACSWNLLLAVCLLIAAQLSQAAPSSSSSSSTETANETAWPPMHHYDIWSADLKSPSAVQQLDMDIDLIEEEELPAHEQLLLQDDNDHDNTYQLSNFSSRQPKVIHLFPVPVDGECLSDDGRRMGNCFNAYECRQKGGQARGECAMGFGVCCVFMADCNGTIANNLTYFVSPGFPSFMPSNFTECKLRVKIMSDDISQLRLDFDHFSLGQPNRRTGVCDGDVFNIRGGPRGSFQLCGQNSGQHLYYDVGIRSLPRQSTLYGSLRPALPANVTVNNLQDQLIEISLNVSKRFLPMRLWEIRVLQIPFNQRAPAGCLQYHTGVEGVLQTFNFAENGRHLANQHYKICVRQELEMCSIIYQPCDEQSFRIGGGMSGGSFMPNMNGSSSSAAPLAATAATGNVTTAATSNLFQLLSNWVNNTTTTSTTAPSTTTAATTVNVSTTTTVAATTERSSSSSTTAMTTAMTTATPVRSSTTAAPDEYPEYDETEEDESEETPSSSPANDDVEGSGGSEDYDNDSIFNFFGGGGNRATTARPGVSRKPRPVGGANTGGSSSSSSSTSSSSGFDLFGFLRSAFDLRLRHRRRRREARQFFSTCSDRITMPCIIEDFIGTGLGPLPGCEPVHCGSQFCSSGVWPCRIESTVTPFYIGVHFGDGNAPGKGNAEDNIGACLRYSQVPCV
ncbi:uncharacterized protein LOC117781250 [Drosophila innubila]|uniref:uncharacterized protein LOC117781250 n=1 Tax=Drosophila innubila TaxID=198719 RepID=UPI00148C9C6F|nr:uncharacterized protein LOC117781250 [Drosophila innubila]